MSDSDRKFTETLMATLAISESTATALISDGFTSIEEIAYVPREELNQALALEGVAASQIQEKAKDFLLKRALKGAGRG